ETSQRADLAVEPEERVSLPKILRGPSRVAPQRDAGPVHRESECGHVGLDHRKAVRLEPEIADDRGTETSDAVRGNRHAHAGSNLACHEQTAGTVTPFEDECSQARLREVRRGHQ